VITRLALPGALAGCAAGILAADAGLETAALAAAGALVIGLLAMGAARGALDLHLLLVACACGAGLVAGLSRGSAAALPTGPDSVSSLVGAGSLRLTGTLVDEPRPNGTSQQAIIDEVRVGAEPGLHVRARLLVRLPRSVAIGIGDRIRFEAVVEAPEAFDGFDYPAFLARQGIGGIARARVAELVARGRGGIAGVAAAVRGWLLRGLNDLVPEPEAALGDGILLGARAGIAPEVSDAFATAGLTHVVAISGWNIAIVAALIGSLTRRMEERRGGRRAAPVLSVAAVAAYVLLTGASPSVVRAALMAGAMLVARLGGSRAHAASALALAALVMLIAAPSVLWDVGFQLSSLATAGLIWFGAPIEARLRRWPGWLREPVALTLAAQTTTLPVIVTTFGRLSLVAPLANVVVVPLVPLAMLASAVAAVVGAASTVVEVPLAGELLAWLGGGSAWLVLRAMIMAGQLAASLPFASLAVVAPGWIALAWYPGLALGARRLRTRAVESNMAGPMELAPAAPLGRLAGRRLRIARALAHRIVRPPALAAGLLLLLCGISVAELPDGQLHLTVLDIGQGDAILVKAPSGPVALIDGGPDPDLLLQRLGEALPWWQRTIDVVILTHPHEDHVGGLPAVLERYRVRLVVDPARAYPNPSYARFLEAARSERGARLVTAVAGQTIRLDGAARLSLLFPSAADRAAPLPAGDINNASIVALLRSGSFTALLSGDAEAPVEALLRRRGLIGPVDLLKVGHHGSTSSSTKEFLDALQPRAALISVGAGNDYGHPHRATLDKLAAIPDLRVHRTDLEGNLEVVSDGDRFRVRSRVVDDGWRAVRAHQPAAAMPGRSESGGPGRIGACPFPPAPRPRRSSRRTACRTASSCTRTASVRWRPGRHICSRGPAWTSTPTSSRSPPCCTTSTRSRRGRAASPTASSAPAGWPSSATRSCPPRWHRTRSTACWIRSELPVIGRRSSWPSPTAASSRPS